MIQSFMSKFGASNAGAGAWPQARVVAVLKRQYQSVDHIGEEEGFTLYGISDNGVNFVVALILSDKDNVAEIGFLARFVGFTVDRGAIETINRNLHLSIAGIEEDGDLYLLAGIEATGSFDEGAFALVLEAWRRDLMMVLHALSGGSSISAAFPAARSATARQFAANAAPVAEGGVMPDLLRGFLGGETKEPCSDCNGRGKRGLIARTCEPCDGTGFVRARR